MRTDDRRRTFPELEIARGFGVQIRAEQPSINTNRELPVDLIQALKEAGIFRAILPSAYGGAELPLPDFVRCVEVIAEADGSTGWCVGQGSVFPNLADRMEPSTAEKIWKGTPTSVVATGTPFGSTALPTEQGFRLNGRWRFASGCLHADWLAAMSNVVDKEGLQTGFGMFLVPKSAVEIGDGWNVQGLRGTGSREYTLADVHVPGEYAMMGAVLREHCGVATKLPAQLLFASAFGAVGIGIARRALDELHAVIEGKTPTFSNRRLMDDDLVHLGLAEAEATWGASRAYLLELAEACAFAHATYGAPSAELRARLRLAATNAMRQSGKVVDKAYELAGSDVVFEDHPIHRCFQDVRALTQQIQARPAHFVLLGARYLGWSRTLLYSDKIIGRT